MECHLKVQMKNYLEEAWQYWKTKGNAQFSKERRHQKMVSNFSRVVAHPHNVQ